MRPSRSTGSIRRIAIINALNDYGIAGYTHEFAEGLAVNGYAVSVYSDVNAPLQELPEKRHYELYPVLGKSLLKQAGRPRLSTPVQYRESIASLCSSVPDAYAFHPESLTNGAARAVEMTSPVGTASPGLTADAAPRSISAGAQSNHFAGSVFGQLRTWVRIRSLSYELAWYLQMRAYDLIWTQWYSPDVLDSTFWGACRTLKLPVVHTVHNVLPHEPAAGDWETYNEIYERSNLLVVHSRHSQRELQSKFPLQAAKSVVMPHGSYSSLHERVPGSREKVRAALGIEPDSPVLLFCGAIRPYKNIDAVIEALARPEFAGTTLIVAGKESKYAEANPSDPLKRTKALLAQHRVPGSVKLIPRMLETAELSELLEASDILLLPYLEGYGSGLLLLGITFGKHVVATAAGGSEEYLQRYENHTLLTGPTTTEVIFGLRQAVARIRRTSSSAEPPASLSWANLTAQVMKEVEQRLADES